MVLEFIYHMNNYCNLHCEFCSDFSDKPIDKNSPWIERRTKWDVPLEEVELFCERFKGIALNKYVHLTGGEPTAMPIEKLNAVIDLLDTYHRRIVLLTNGFNVFGVGKEQLKKCAVIKLDDHGINNEHLLDCVKYLNSFTKGNIKHIYTLHHYDLDATRKLAINKGGHCPRATLLSDIEIVIKQSVVYPCCAMASFDLYNNDTQMNDELIKAGWTLDNPSLLKTVLNFKKTLPTYVVKQCKEKCWWPHKRILGPTEITLKPNDVIRKP